MRITNKNFIFIVVPHYYSPPDFGGAVRIYNIIKRLLESRIVPVIFEISEKTNSKKISNEKILYIRYKQFKCPFYIIPISILLLKLLHKFRVKVVLIEYTTFRTAFLVPFIRLFKPDTIIIIDAHNVEYIAKKKRWPVPFLVLTYIFEFLAVKLAHVVFCVSDLDKKIFKTFYKRKRRIYLAPNGVNISDFMKVKAIKRKEIRAVFHGLYIYKPNKEAFEFIINKIAPKLPNITFILFGKDTENLKNKDLPKNVKVLGTLPKEKVIEVIKSSNIAVVPIFWGSGTNLKVIEYMAAGLTIVATKKAVRGLNLKPDEDFYLAKNDKEFIEKIKLAVEKPIDPNRLIEKAKKFDWSNTLSPIVKAIKNLIKKS